VGDARPLGGTRLAARLPWWTLAVAAGALAASLAPALAAALVYERDAIAQGELWRLASGHLVHFSALHLTVNLLVLLSAGWLLERRDPGAGPWLYGLSMPAIGGLLWLTDPALAQFGGASGLACAVLAAYALGELAAGGRRRALGGVLFAALLLKLAGEWGGSWSLPGVASSGEFVAVPASHAAGAALGALVWLVRRPSAGRGIPACHCAAAWRAPACRSACSAPGRPANSAARSSHRRSPA
jgi:rhomboid family GlyGly-CTERM serine protease